jgi:hypothetical protein
MDRDLPATPFGPTFGSIGVVGGVLEGDPLLLRGRHRAAVAGPESPAQTALSPRIPCVAPPMPGTPILHPFWATTGGPRTHLGSSPYIFTQLRGR